MISCHGRKPAGCGGPGVRLVVVSGHSANHATSMSLSNCCQTKPATFRTSSTRVIGGIGGNMAGPAAQAVAKECIAGDDIAIGWRENAANKKRQDPLIGPWRRTLPPNARGKLRAARLDS